MYVATINIPGYLPMDDEPPTFETPAEAWSYLADERQDSEDSATAAEFADDEVDWTEDYSQTFRDLRSHAVWAASGLVTDSEATGTVYGDTPGYDGDHDLGLAYSVTEVE